MAKDQSKRLNPSLVEADKVSLAALMAITNYSPANPAFATAAITAAQAELDTAQQAEAQTAAAAATAVITPSAKEALHGCIRC